MALLMSYYLLSIVLFPFSIIVIVIIHRFHAITNILCSCLSLHTCKQLLTVGERMLGEKLLGYAVAPFYNQFVAGDSEEEMALVSRNLAGVGVRLMVAPMLETDVGEGHDL